MILPAPDVVMAPPASTFPGPDKEILLLPAWALRDIFVSEYILPVAVTEDCPTRLKSIEFPARL